jgi:hypothetical protein
MNFIHDLFGLMQDNSVNNALSIHGKHEKLLQRFPLFIAFAVTKEMSLYEEDAADCCHAGDCAADCISRALIPIQSSREQGA